MIKRAFNLRRPREKTVLFSKVSRISHHESDNTEAEPTQDREKDFDEDKMQVQERLQKMKELQAKIRIKPRKSKASLVSPKSGVERFMSRHNLNIVTTKEQKKFNKTTK